MCLLMCFVILGFQKAMVDIETNTMEESIWARQRCPSDGRDLWMPAAARAAGAAGARTLQVASGLAREMSVFDIV